MAAVRDVPNKTRQKVAIGARHRLFLKAHFHDQNEASTFKRRFVLHLHQGFHSKKNGFETLAKIASFMVLAIASCPLPVARLPIEVACCRKLIVSTVQGPVAN